MASSLTASSASLNALLADGFNKGESPEQREGRRQDSLAAVRRACEADGLSEALTKELVNDLQRAFYSADVFNTIVDLATKGS